jgi:hypothetical protein
MNGRFHLTPLNRVARTQGLERLNRLIALYLRLQQLLEVESGASQTNVRVGDATPFHQPEVWRVHHPRTSENLWKTVCPVSFRINLRVVRANTGAPNDSSSCLICELILGCDTCRTSLAFRRLPSFATAQK